MSLSPAELQRNAIHHGHNTVSFRSADNIDTCSNMTTSACFTKMERRETIDCENTGSVHCIFREENLDPYSENESSSCFIMWKPFSDMVLVHFSHYRDNVKENQYKSSSECFCPAG